MAMQETYEMKRCSECGSGIPVNPSQSMVTCGFCGAEYDIINHGGQADRQAGDHQISATTAFFIGGILGMGLGAVIFTATGRSMAVKAISKGGQLAERTVEGWLKTGETKPL